jgi:hypothetical protein
MYVDKKMIDIKHNHIHRADLALCEHMVTGRLVIHYYPVGANPLPKPSGFVENHDSMAKAEAHLVEMFPSNAGYELITVVGQTV